MLDELFERFKRAEGEFFKAEIEFKQTMKQLGRYRPFSHDDHPAHDSILPYRKEYEEAMAQLRNAAPEKLECYHAFERRWGARLRGTGWFPTDDRPSAQAFIARQGERAAEEHTSNLERYQREREELLSRLRKPMVPVPAGWEGERPEREIKSSFDLIAYLDERLKFLRIWAAFSYEQCLLASTYALRNALRVLDDLRIFERPSWPNDPTDTVEAERKLSELIAAMRLLNNGGSSTDVGPRWDSARCELRFDGEVCKRFKQPAKNQKAILSAFEEEHWPSRIEDPLPPLSRESDPKKRLNDTIRNLMNGCEFMHFRLDGTGTGVLWEREG
jgi:hypothetical protein